MSRRLTEHDLLIRPTNAAVSVSTAREWLYNRRSELAAANVGTNVYGYAYDSIGNRLRSSENATTNSYAANCLNQCVSAGRDVPAAPQTAIHYDADGNMTDDGEFAYSYDAENRLVSVVPLSPAVGSLSVENRYDHRHRRVRKTVRRHDGSAWETAETHTFVWDGGDVVLEKVEFADGATRTFEYFWGMDRSGAEQGAGGVGGLLAVSVDGAFYVPCYDHNGNIILYVSETGGVAAQYVYDPYGGVIESHGTLADAFAFGFSTKYLDRETGLIAYQRRFYSPALGRWLNRDPIEEDGGENLYAFCGNNPVAKYDILGTSTCCRNGKKENCDNFYKWEGTAETLSATWGVGVTFLIVDIKSNFVCMTCSRWRIHFKAVLLTASWARRFLLQVQMSDSATCLQMRLLVQLGL